MASTPKIAVRKLLSLVEKFKDDPARADDVSYWKDQANWIVRRQEAKFKGAFLRKWESKNPNPSFYMKRDYHHDFVLLNDDYDPDLVGDDIKETWHTPNHLMNDRAKFGQQITSPKGFATKDPNSSDWYRNTTVGKDIVIPECDLKEIDKIREAKSKIRIKAIYAAETGNEEDIKNLAKIAKRLDIEEKRLIFKYDFEAFDEYLFQDIQDRVKTPDFHKQMFKLYQHSKRSCVICPRGFAKSTNARKYLVHQMVYKQTSYLVLIGASEGMASQNLVWVRDQFTDNRKLIELYGNLQNKDKWAETEFEIYFKNEKGEIENRCKGVAKGAGQKIRGMNEKGRPDLYYIDDLEEDEQVDSRERRDKLKSWFLKALLPSMAKNGRVIITGTILHLDSLLRNISLNKVKDNILWDVLFFQAINIDKDGNEYSLWEEHKPLSMLKALREADDVTFSQEYQNNPRAGLQAVFHEKYFEYYTYDKIRRSGLNDLYYLDQPLNIMITTDFAYSKRSGSDYTVYMATGMDKYSNLYVLEYLRFKEDDSLEQINMLFDFSKKWGCTYFVIEKQQYQAALKRFIEVKMTEKNYFLHIHEIERRDTTKFMRIKGLQQPIRAGKIKWLQGSDDLENELLQVTATSLGTHDDIIDCLADAWSVQFEAHDIFKSKEPEINTIEWMAAQGAWGDESHLLLY